VPAQSSLSSLARAKINRRIAPGTFAVRGGAGRLCPVL